MNKYRAWDEEKKEITSEELLNWMAEKQSDFMMYGFSPYDPGVYPVRHIAKMLGTSVYRVRKCLERLKAEELVELGIYNYSDEYECFPPVKMYRLTKKAWQLPNIKKIEKSVEKKILEHFKIGTSEVE